MFINYNVNSGISINPYRIPGYANSNITGLVDDIIDGCNGSCPLEGARALLEDATTWQGSNVTQELLEELHNVICDYEQYGQYGEEVQ